MSIPATEIRDAVKLVRVSTKTQEDEGYSSEAQDKLLTEYAHRNKLNIKKPFKIAETASKPLQRKVFKEMMEYVLEKDIKVIVVEKVDRMVRNFSDVVEVDNWLSVDEQRQVHFVKDSLVLHKNSKSQEKLNWGVRVVIAKNFIDNLKEEIDKGVKEKLAQGWFPGGTPKRGYMNIKVDDKTIQVIDKKVAPLIVKMFELYLSPNHSLTTLTAEMKRLGLATKKGRPLVRSHIGKLLRSTTYIGMVEWHGKEYPGRHKPIIDKAVFEAVQAKLTGKAQPKYSKHNYLFKGMYQCTTCAGTITWEQHKGIIYGHCNGYRECPKKKWITEEKADQDIAERLENLLSPSTDIMEWTKQALKERHRNDIEAYEASYGQLQSRHDTLKRKLDILYDDRLEEQISKSHYKDKEKEINDEIDYTNEQLKTFDKTYASKLSYGIDMLELSQRAAQIYQSKKQVEKRRELLAQIFSNLRVDGQTTDYEYSKAVTFIANKSEKHRLAKNNFELITHPSKNDEEAYEKASKSIWSPFTTRLEPIL